MGDLKLANSDADREGWLSKVVEFGIEATTWSNERWDAVPQFFVRPHCSNKGGTDRQGV